MNLDALVTRGFLAWEPSAAVRDLDVWWMYQVPHVGTFVFDDTTVLFGAAGDPTQGPGSVWAYLPLTSDEVAMLADVTFEDVADLNERLGELFAGKEAVFALARDYRIERYSWVEVRRRRRDCSGCSWRQIGSSLRSSSSRAITTRSFRSASNAPRSTRGPRSW